MRVRNWLSLSLILGLSVTALKNCPMEGMFFQVEDQACSHCAQESKPVSKNFLCCIQPGALSAHVQSPSLDSASPNPLLAAAEQPISNPDFAVHSLRQSNSAASPPRASPIRLTTRAPPA